MYRPLAFYIGLRYTRAKRRNHFISFISGFSMTGIALGVAVLMTVLSVMNGFDEQIKMKVFTMIPHATVHSYAGPLKDWENLLKKIETLPGVAGVAPYVNGEALMTNRGIVMPALITGIDPIYQNNVSDLSQKMVTGSLENLTPKSYGIVLGEGLAGSLGVGMGGKVIVMTPQGTVTPVGFVPRVKRFTVVGIFHAGDGFSFDSAYAFINLSDAKTLYNLDEGITGLRLKILDVFGVQQFSARLNDKLDNQYSVNNWTRQLGAFFQAVALEKNMMFIILLLIIAVAAFNLVSTLVMVVNEKRADIAILRTLGATPRMIMAIFVVQGAVIGILGVLLGLIGGLLLTHYVNEIAELIQRVFHVQLISASVYIVDYLPTKIELSDIIKIMTIALMMCLAATLYPAWRASKTQPAEALRYE